MNKEIEISRIARLNRRINCNIKIQNILTTDNPLLNRGAMAICCRGLLSAVLKYQFLPPPWIGLRGVGWCVQTLKIPLFFLTVPNTARHYSISVIVNFYVSVYGNNITVNACWNGIFYIILRPAWEGEKIKTFWPLFVFYGSVWSVIGGR